MAPVSEIIRVKILNIEVHSFVLVDTTSVDVAQNACRNRLSSSHCLRTKTRCVGIHHCPTRESDYIYPFSEED